MIEIKGLVIFTPLPATGLGFVCWSDGMWCCRSDWSGLCLLSTLVCCQPTELIWAFSFLFHKFSNLLPPPSLYHPPGSLLRVLMVLSEYGTWEKVWWVTYPFWKWYWSTYPIRKADTGALTLLGKLILEHPCLHPTREEEAQIDSGQMDEIEHLCEVPRYVELVGWSWGSVICLTGELKRHITLFD